VAQRNISASALAFFRAFIGFARWRAAVAAILIGLGAVFEGVGLLLLVPVLEVVTTPGEGRSPGGSFAQALFAPIRDYGRTERLLALLGVFVLLMAVRSVVLATRDRSINRLRLEFVESIRMDLIDRLAAAPWRDVVRIRHVRMVQALGVEIHQLGNASNAMVRSAVALAMLAGYCALALMLAPLAGLLGISCALAGALIGRPYLKRSRRLGKAIVEAQLDMTDGAMVFLHGLKLATAQGLQSNFVRQYAAASSSAMRDQLRFLDYQTQLANTTSTVAAAVGAATLFAGLVIFHLAPSVLITLLLILSRMNVPALTIQQGAQEVLHCLPAFDMILALEDDLSRTAPANDADPAPPSRASGREPLVFRNVTFRYASSPEAPPQLENVSLTIPAGAFVGVVGPSGAGKTTFLDLAAGLLRAQSGKVHAHGYNLAGAGLSKFRETLAYVAQDPFLFDDTIRGNLLWSQPGCSDAEIHESLELVGGEHLLGRLENRLDTRIGERGLLVSAGERQRLALARAILRRPTLLILDEATNAIDILSERAVLEGLASLTPRTTILMVAHRRESLRLCDHLLEVPGYVLSRRRTETSAAYVSAGERG
jgi:ATP-binding cassette subfamily C protein